MFPKFRSKHENTNALKFSNLTTSSIKLAKIKIKTKTKKINAMTT
jgi:hypothetical protein